jgi:hypothetical protein
VVHTTAKRFATLTPVWNERFHFRVPRADAVLRLVRKPTHTVCCVVLFGGSGQGWGVLSLAHQLVTVMCSVCALVCCCRRCMIGT